MNTELILPAESVSPAEMRSKIVALEAVMLASPENIVELETLHHFAPGVYMRELRIPKGVLLTGKIHKTEHLNIFTHGDLSVWTENGMRRLNSHEIILSKPGIKRVGYAHEDSVWITVHPNVTDETDVKVLEDKLVTNNFELLDATILKTLTDGGV